MPQTVVIKVALPRDRTKTGTLTLIDPLTGLPAFGPVPVLGRAARNTAGQHHNPSGDPLQPYGDTPLGSYAAPSVLASGDGTAHPALAYGSRGVIVLDPVGGPSARAQANGRTGLLIHAGRQATNPTLPATALKPTNGCLRMIEQDLGGLIDALRANALLFPAEVHVEITQQAGPAATIDDTIDDGDPPVLQGTPIVP